MHRGSTICIRKSNRVIVHEKSTAEATRLKVNSAHHLLERHGLG